MNHKSETMSLVCDACKQCNALVHCEICRILEVTVGIGMTGVESTLGTTELDLQPLASLGILCLVSLILMGVAVAVSGASGDCSSEIGLKFLDCSL